MIKKIKKLREKIDKIDSKIVKLLEKRLKIVKKIGKIKQKKGFKLTDKRREKEIIKKLKTIAQNPILKKQIDNFYKMIFNLSKTVMKIKKRNY